MNQLLWGRLALRPLLAASSLQRHVAVPSPWLRQLQAAPFSTKQARVRTKKARKATVWSPVEDENLRNGIKRHGNDWQSIIRESLAHKDKLQCYKRWTTVLSTRVKMGRWSPEEDAKLTELVKRIDGHARWSRIAQHMDGRLDSRCRERWMTVLDPTLKKGAWSAEEDAVLTECFAKYGRSWAAISAHLPGRCPPSIRYRHRSLTKQRASWAKWTAQEDAVLRAAVEVHGVRQWRLVAKHLPNRDNRQCSYRWEHFSRVALDLGMWTEREDALLIHSVAKYGDSGGHWAAVAANIRGKNGKECRLRWERELSRRLNTEPWSAAEDAIIVRLRGAGRKLRHLYPHLKGRGLQAIKQRCQELGCGIADSLWTAEQRECLLGAMPPAGVRKVWKAIAAHVPGRSASQCESFWQYSLKLTAAQKKLQQQQQQQQPSGNAM